MKTSRFAIMILSMITAFVSFRANAQDPNRAMRMEASLSCPNGDCSFSSITAGGGIGSAARLQRINDFDIEAPIQHETESSQGQRFVPIGQVKPNQSVPNFSGGLTTSDDHATGFLISPCLAVTNFHAVYGHDIRAPRPNQSYSATLTLRKGREEIAAIGTPIFHGRYEGPGTGDWVVLRLNDCLGERPDVGWMETGNISLDRFANLVLGTAGYFGDVSATQLHGDPNCQVRTSEGLTLLHDCRNTGGASGAPMFAMVRGIPLVLAMQSGMKQVVAGKTTYSNENANVGLSMSEIFARPGVSQEVDRDRARVPSGNPILKLKTPARPMSQT